MDNLESQTYEVFEKDPIKYAQYQQVSREPPEFSYFIQIGSFLCTLWHLIRLCTVYLLPQAVYKCLLDRVPEEQKETNVQ